MIDHGLGLVGPQVPHFPVFTRSGEVTVSIDPVSSSFTFTEEQHAQICHFHRFVFTRVLRLEKDPMVFDPDKALSSYIIVPLLKGRSLKNRDFSFFMSYSATAYHCLFDFNPDDEGIRVDWAFVAEIQKSPLRLSRRKYLHESAKEKFVFNEEDFFDAVVMPSYRNIDQPQYFYVAEIRKDLNPRCPFPSPELYDTFEHYYNSKYGLGITNLQQPLLDVDHTSARLNLLTPRYMNQKGVALPTSSAETRKARRENLQQKQILIPELCDIHPFPASLWRKAVCIPAILYRMNYLLVAEEIRMMIAEAAHIGVAKIPEDYCFSELEFGFSTKPGDGKRVFREGDDGSMEDDLEEREDPEAHPKDEDSPKELENGRINPVHSDMASVEPEMRSLKIEDSEAATDSSVKAADVENNLEAPCDNATQAADDSEADALNSALIKFDEEVDLEYFIGPSPCLILQTLTMSNANDFFNLERLETIGDSFLKFAITVYLYCEYPGIHEGKLSYLRSKQVSNYNLYKLGKKKGFPDCMVAVKFEPTENWLPPGYVIRKEGAYKGLNVRIASVPGPLHDSLVIESCQNDQSDKENESDEGEDSNKENKEEELSSNQMIKFTKELEECTKSEELEKVSKSSEGVRMLIPYNLQTQHSLPDKSIADCVEALIGCYLTTCGQRAALQFMSWLGLKVLPEDGSDDADTDWPHHIRISGFGRLPPPPLPLLTHVVNAQEVLSHHLDGYDAFEEKIKYKFNDRSYLLQAFTHASYHYNTVTDCYQRHVISAIHFSSSTCLGLFNNLCSLTGWNSLEMPFWITSSPDIFLKTPRNTLQVFQLTSVLSWFLPDRMMRVDLR